MKIPLSDSLVKGDKVWRHSFLPARPLMFHFSSVKTLLSGMWECGIVGFFPVCIIYII